MGTNRFAGLSPRSRVLTGIAIRSSSAVAAHLLLVATERTGHAGDEEVVERAAESLRGGARGGHRDREHLEVPAQRAAGEHVGAGRLGHEELAPQRAAIRSASSALGREPRSGG